MRKLIRGLIYKQWLYGLLAVVLWFDRWTDVEDAIKAFSPASFFP